MITRTLSLAVVLAVSAGQALPQSRQLNFVSCPLVQDTKTVPCWLSEHQGELYYLGIQSDISAEFHPPYLGHRVLVEGVLSDEPRICGGIVLKPVRVSPLPEADGTCNTILPAVDKYTVPFAPRPPGPSGGRLAFQAPPAPKVELKPPFMPREFKLYYDFNMTVMGRHATVLSQIVEYIEMAHASRITITAYRGATLLSNGELLSEKPEMAKARADEMLDLLRRAGHSGPAPRVDSPSEPQPADGIEDWRSRSVTVLVEP